MNKAEKKIVWYAVAAILVLLTVLLGIINIIGFTMAAEDADRLTQRLADRSGSFGQMFIDPSGYRKGDMSKNGIMEKDGKFGPMGPDSPDINASLRYFTYSFDSDGSGRMESYQLSAVSEEEAVSWAKALAKEKTGWTHGTYRYRTYELNGRIFVTVIDCGRELLPAYRILIFSICGAILGVLLSFAVLRMVGRKLFAPIEEADLKQKKFIANAEKEFKLPLTVINADAEVLEKELGSNDQTRSIHRQIRKMNALVRNLGTLVIFDDKKMAKTLFSLSDQLKESLDRNESRFESKNLKLSVQVADNLSLKGEPEAMQQAISEIIENTMRYARSRAEFRLSGNSERIQFEVINDTELPAGSVNQVFDRFTVLDNAAEGSVGLGLAYVKDIIRAHNGRISAKVENGNFVLHIDL